VGERYELLGLLGRGGMAEVFAAREVGTGRRIALKRIRFRDREARRSDRLRFRREFHTLTSLRHSRIVRALDYGRDGERDFYTMELLDGRDLAEAVREAPLSIADACRALRDVASALAYLHSRRLLHRDLSPRNVRLTSDGNAKLIDFGVLATPGVARDVAGTPMVVAPEGLRGQPLDERTDVFGLGTLAYWMLTGRHAYPVRRFDELEDAWSDPPPPVRALREDVPPALDELVRAMIQTDAQLRPRSAAEVWDRLGGIADLPAMPQEEAARDFVLTAPLVGRSQELAMLRALARNAVQKGRGSAVVVEAHSGGGKSRLLREAGVAAQLAGAAVARVAADAADARPFAVASSLCEQVFQVCPTDAQAAAEPRAAILGRVLEPVRRRFPSTPLAAPLPDPAEDRLAVQAEVVGFFREAATRRPLALFVDDVQRSDEASAAVLATLGRRTSAVALHLVAALRTDEAPRARAALRALVAGGLHVRLAPLDADDVRELVVGTLGDVEHADALSDLLHREASGSPMRCVELLRYLVDGGIVRYAEGSWLVPPRFDDLELPSDLAAAMDHRVRSLPPKARSLAEALAVQGGELSLDLVRGLAEPGEHDDAVFDALNELVFHEMLGGSGTSWHFRHDGLREALLRALAPERRRTLHRRAAAALTSGAAVPRERELEVGWHLVRGGDEAAGAELLERGGRRLYEARSFRDALAPLEGALRIHEARGTTETRRLELRKMLMRAGVLCDRRILLRYAEGTLSALRRHSGMTWTSKLRPWLGRPLAVLVGHLAAWIAWALSTRAARGPAPHRALADFVLLVNFAASAHSLSFDTAAVQRLIDLLEPLTFLRRRVPGAAAAYTRNFWRMAAGHFGTAARSVPGIVEVLEEDRLTPIPEIDRRMGKGGALYMLASVEALMTWPSYERHLERLAALELRFFDASTQMARLFFHRLRGEEDRARAAHAEGAMRAVQLGSVWVFEAQLEWISALGYGLTGDLLGLKQSAAALERMAKAGYRFRPHARIARADHDRHRGNAAAARALLRETLEQIPDDARFLRQWARTVAAEAALDLAELDDAARLAQHASRVDDGAPEDLTVLHVRARRALGLALARAGRADEGRAVLERARHELGDLANPAASGVLEEALAEVSGLLGDEPAAAQHRTAVHAFFRETGNPVLLARAARAAEAAGSPRAVARPADDDGEEPATAVQGPTGRGRLARRLFDAPSQERPARVLEVCAELGGASRAWLFRVRGLHLQRLAGDDEDPPEAILEEARSFVTRPRGDASAEESSVLSAEGGRYRLVPLELPRPDGRGLVAVVVLEGDRAPQPVASGLRTTAARALHALESDSDQTLLRSDFETPLLDETDVDDLG
jgi:serine/threonine-protein kinase